MTTYQQEALQDLRDEISPIFAEHWDALALNKDTIPLDVDWDMYRRLELAGILHLTTARIGRTLAGYASFIVGTHLHHKGLVVASEDMFYVRREFRQGLSGAARIKGLLKAAEAHLATLGVSAMTVKTKLHRDIGAVLESAGYAPIERAYLKSVGGP